MIVCILAVALAAQVDEPGAKGSRATTTIELPSGRSLVLEGEWEQSDVLWGDHAIVGMGSDNWGGMSVLEPGEAKPRLVVPYDKRCREGYASGPPIWSDDGGTCFAWLGGCRQLCAVDTATSTFRPVIHLEHDAESTTSWQRNPEPLRGAPAGFFDPELGAVLAVLADGFGGDGAIVAIDLESRRARTISGKRRLTNLRSWVWCRSREELFYVGPMSQVRSCSKIGQPLRSVGQSASAEAITLSPDERTLLLAQTRVRPFREGDDDKSAGFAFGGPGVKRMSIIREGGFAFVDVDTLAVTPGPTTGHRPGWATDSKRFGYLDDWTIRIGTLDATTSELVATVVPASDNHRGPQYYDAPSWSPDGHTILFNVGEPDCLQVLDLEAHRVMLAEGMSHPSWAPNARPFRSK